MNGFEARGRRTFRQPAADDPVASIAVSGAHEVLRPPQDGLHYLRHDRAEDLRTAGGSLATLGKEIVSFDDVGDAELRVNARECAVIPGFIDSHTHLPFVGWRSTEYALKVAGVGYDEIARQGGGIRASSEAFASASDTEILRQARTLAVEMLQAGTTTLECKSGYGLSLPAELRALRLAHRLDELIAQDTTRTALLAHAVPPGYSREQWMDEVAVAVPQVIREADVSALDIYVETVAFSNADLTRIAGLARDNGVALRCHVEQFSTQRSVPVAVEHGARSVDHLACLHDDDVELLAASECAAVFLPGAEFLGDEHVAPARELADSGAICVLATDANPGTSPIVSMPLVIGLAVRRYGWSVQEALLAASLNAAWTLGLSGDRGSLEIGKRADFLLLDGPIDHIPYRLGHNPVVASVIGGQPAYVRLGEEWRFER